MTQDWSMIPIHIRCTQRERIDPNYPRDGTKFWRAVHQMRGNHTTEVYGKVPRAVLEYAHQIKEDRLALENLAGVCRMPLDLIAKGARGVKKGEGHRGRRSQHRYEEMSETEVRLDKWIKENA